MFFTPNLNQEDHNTLIAILLRNPNLCVPLLLEELESAYSSAADILVCRCVLQESPSIREQIQQDLKSIRARSVELNDLAETLQQACA